jgi:hypothetical protein
MLFALDVGIGLDKSLPQPRQMILSGSHLPVQLSIYAGFWMVE